MSSAAADSAAQGATANNYDLLRRATQAMMSSRSAAADDDGTDQIGSDTPRSGVATPQPDLHDKRLPGIMSYFNQVRPASFKRLLSGNFTTPSVPSTTTTTSTPTPASAASSIVPTNTTTATAPSTTTPPLECEHAPELLCPSAPEPEVQPQPQLQPGSASMPPPPLPPPSRTAALPVPPAPSTPAPLSTDAPPPVSTSDFSGDEEPPLLHERMGQHLPKPEVQPPCQQPPPPPLEQASLREDMESAKPSLHPYPTPPASIRDAGTSAGGGREVEESGETQSGRKDGAGSSNGNTPHSAWDAPWTFRHKKSVSDVPDARAPPEYASTAPLVGVVTPSTVLARHFSVPSIPPLPSPSTPCPPTTTKQHASTAPDTPVQSHFPAADTSAPAPSSSCPRSASVGQLKKLTVMTREKSGQSTPTRSLSTARPSLGDAGGTSTAGDDSSQQAGTRESSISRATSSTPTPGVAQAPAAKGKLTIKISEARGLRRSRDPYVVAVFQRSELISGGPRPSEEDDHAVVAAVAMGGIPIQRQASDTGRIPMAIPMRSRQSSNTSMTDYNTFRNRSARRSLTNPKWDAEAIFDVVDSDMLVDVSVYDHSPAGEEFLGHVDFQAHNSEKDGTIRGWFPLRGHADTVADKEPTGEIYVEALYQRSDRKHFGPDDFEILRLIGKGTFGQVYQVRKKDTKRIYAMKVLSKKKIVQKKEVAHTVGERNILVRTATSDSPFIVGLKFSFQTPSDLYLVTDYMSGGELFWHLQKEGRFEEHRAKFYIAELILAIEHLHNNDIVYRDLKPENILLDANGHIALCDFGLSKANLTKNDTTNTFCGTTEYLAPEVLLDEAGYTKMVDFWSLGVLVFEMCCGWSPFYAEDTQQMYKNIAFGKVRFPKDTLSAEGRSFVKGLLNRNPKHRLGATKDAAELMGHPFFNDIDWTALSKKLITPPFKPKLKSDTDVSYFDPAFTDAMDKSGSLNERAAALARGIATSTPLSPSMQANFQGFTFVDESALDDHMRGRGAYNGQGDDEDDDMYDATGTVRGGSHGHKDETDWDDLRDVDPRREGRMSGIVRTTTEEQMFGTTHFDM